MNLTDEFGFRWVLPRHGPSSPDVEKIAPCLPGIWLREVAGDEYQGVVKVKAGPVTASYEGVARYLLLDADAHQAVLKAEGHEIHGQGKGTALVTATLFPSAEAPGSRSSRFSRSTAGSRSLPVMRWPPCRAI